MASWTAIFEASDVTPTRVLAGRITLAVVLSGVAVSGQGQPRFRKDPFQIKRITGVTEAESRDFSARIAAMHDFLGGLAEVREPKPPECSYVYTNTEQAKHAGTGSVAASSVIGIMTSPPNGPCPRVDNTSIVFRLNDVTRVYQCSMEVGPDRYCMIPPFQRRPDGWLESHGRTSFYLWLRGKEPLLAQVTKEEYLLAWEREC